MCVGNETTHRASPILAVWGKGRNRLRFPAKVVAINTFPDLISQLSRPAHQTLYLYYGIYLTQLAVLTDVSMTASKTTTTIITRIGVTIW